MKAIVFFSLFFMAVLAWKSEEITSNGIIRKECLLLKVQKGRKGASISATLKNYERKWEKSEIPIAIFDEKLINKAPSGGRGNRRPGSVASTKSYEEVFENIEALTSSSTSKYHGALSGKVGEVVSVTLSETGSYCVYYVEAFPPASATPDTNQRIQIDIQFRNSYGYLPVKVYTEMILERYFAAISFVLTSGVYWYINMHGRNDPKKDRSAMRNLSIISKVFLYYVLGPRLMLAILKCLTLWSINSYFPIQAGLYYDNDVSGPSFVTFLLYLEDVFNVCVKFFMLLFTMGYGVIYCMENSNTYRRIPSRYWNRALNLFVFNTFSVTLKSLMETWLDYFIDFTRFLPMEARIPGATGGGRMRFAGDSRVYDHDNNINPILQIRSLRIIEPFLDLINAAFPYFWYFLSVIYFFKTLNSIRKFSNNSPGGQIVSSSYYKSVSFVIILPLIIACVIAAFSIKSLNKFNNSVSFRRNGISRESVAEERQRMYFDQSYQVQLVCANYSLYLLSSIMIFFIWVKDNAGVIVDEIAPEEIEMFSKDEND